MLNGKYIYHPSVAFVNNSTLIQSGLQDGINIYTFTIREFIGSVLLIQPSSSSFLPEWLQWFFFELSIKISQGKPYPIERGWCRYNQMDMQEDVQEDSGWKLVHGDVFRPPKYTLLLSVLLGSGSQLFMMVGATTS